jgi:hypothetical protein
VTAWVIMSEHEGSAAVRGVVLDNEARAAEEAERIAKQMGDYKPNGPRCWTKSFLNSVWIEPFTVIT